MTKDEWKIEIENQIKFDHDYIPSFKTTIQILCEMLEERDRVYQKYIESGAAPVVNFTSDRGAVNLKSNPLLRQWQEINTACLAYLRELGLTAAGLRKLQGQIPKERGDDDNFLDRFRAEHGLNISKDANGYLKLDTRIMTAGRGNKAATTTTTKGAKKNGKAKK